MVQPRGARPREPMQRLSPQDAAFLHVEDTVSNMSIGAVAILEGPPPGYEALVRMVRAHLRSVPRYRQGVHFVPLALGRPVWVDDPHFNLGYHLRHTALPQPGGDRELRELVATWDVPAARPRQAPVGDVDRRGAWRGGAGRRSRRCITAWSTASGGWELLSVILDAERDPACRPRRLAPGAPADGGRAGDRGAPRRAVSPYEPLRAARFAAGSPDRAAGTAVATARGLFAMAGVVAPPPPSSLNGVIGPHRRWAWARRGSRMSSASAARSAAPSTTWS